MNNEHVRGTLRRVLLGYITTHPGKSVKEICDGVRTTLLQNGCSTSIGNVSAGVSSLVGLKLCHYRANLKGRDPNGRMRFVVYAGKAPFGRDVHGASYGAKYRTRGRKSRFTRITENVETPITPVSKKDDVDVQMAIAIGEKDTLMVNWSDARNLYNKLHAIFGKD